MARPRVDKRLQEIQKGIAEIKTMLQDKNHPNPPKSDFIEKNKPETDEELIDPLAEPEVDQEDG